MTDAAGVDQPLALELRGITRRFGDVTALDSVDLRVRAGSVHAVLGENGAGKTTLMRIAFGIERADSGAIRLFGRAMHGGSVVRSASAGVGMVHQHLSVVPNLTTTENLMLGGGRRGRYHPARARALLEQTCEAAGLPVTPGVPVRNLSLVEQQRLEIVKALAFGARLLILDEPTAVLAPSEVDDLLRWVRQFVSKGGTVVLVTHKLREALSVADDVTVLRRGVVVLSLPAAQGTERSLASAMFPDAPALETSPTVAAPAVHAAAVEATNVDVTDDAGTTRVRAASFVLRRGELIGVAAVEGSGHRELMAALAGLRVVRSGVLRLPTRIALIPADRARDAIVPDFTLTENLALHGAGDRRGLMNWLALSRFADDLIRRFSIVAPSSAARMRTLSGGNQQRFVVARELEAGRAMSRRERDPAVAAPALDLLIADNPTRGLDLHASAFVHEQLRRAAAQGTTVVVHSSDLDEVLALATRVLVVHHGSVAEYPPDRDVVGRAMLGAA